VLAAILLVPALLIVGWLVLLVRLTSRGPGIFRQPRVGRHGRPFVMYKIRTMRRDAEARSGARWCQVNDPRVTRIGGLLRRLHLDEFPQLLNVLKGEMSLIGPRPERPEFVYVLRRKISGYDKRLAVRPGITGLAQINLGPDFDIASVRRKLVLDLEYVERAGFLLDARIFLCTALTMIGISGDRARRVLKLHRDVPEFDEETLSAQQASEASAESPALSGKPTAADRVPATVREQKVGSEDKRTPAGIAGHPLRDGRPARRRITEGAKRQ
jgi:lipopolysaccharide/colanic/teichoic acid biosynthesis glycosyltransferase